MFSSRRAAQLGLGAACLIFVSSLAVLVAGATGSAGSSTPTATVSVPSDGHGYAAMAVDDAKPSDSVAKR